MKIKNVLIILSTIFLLIACSDKETEVKEKTDIQASVGEIKIIQNNDFLKSKVEEKENNLDRSYYYTYNKEIESKDITYSKLNANIRIRSPYEKVKISMLVSKLSKNFILKCSACHNDYANGIIGPSLLNKDENFIYSSINDFKTGKKINVLMSELVRNMDEKEIKELSKEIATFNNKIKSL